MILETFVAHAPLVTAVLVSSMWQGLGFTTLMLATQALLGPERRTARYVMALLTLGAMTLVPAVALITALAKPLTSSAVPAGAGSSDGPHFSTAVATTWVLGVIAMLFRIAGGRWHLSRLVARSTPLPAEWEARFASLLERFAPLRAFARCSLDIDVPMALGWLRPPSCCPPP